MAIIREEKKENFTIMKNHHFKNKGLSLKAKGLLSQMLSLPEEWIYTIKGLATLCDDGETSVRTAMNELKTHGYVEYKGRVQDEKGQFGEARYIIREIPVNPVDNDEPVKEKSKGKSKAKNTSKLTLIKSEKQEENVVNTKDVPNFDLPISENPILDKPTLDKPILELPIFDEPNVENPRLDNPKQEKQALLSIKLLNTNKSNTKFIKDSSELAVQTPPSCENSDFGEMKSAILNSKAKNKKELLSKEKLLKTFSHDRIEYKSAKFLADKILELDPKNRYAPRDEQGLYKWCIHIDYILRLDGRTVEELRTVLKYATIDPFWRANILSTSKLRAKFDTLILQANLQAEKDKKTANRTPANTPKLAFDLNNLGKFKNALDKNKPSFTAFNPNNLGGFKNALDK
ncbi:MAG: helix-turn-helix domain-containing protein [Defluviitaleaceae bacterium]|nr:helix-turn-helix domain-containing protein [Defluviitaleaceae bacterium]